jgi:subtilisin family serine protease
MTAPTARTLLASRYPDLLVDLNALYRPQAQVVLPGPDYAERLIGWGRAPDDCGAGVRVGLLDTAVDSEIAALRHANIIQQSFLPDGAEPAAKEHGTAVAAILVGQAAGGGRGLLPGAELNIAEVFAADVSGAPTAQALALVGGLDWLVTRSVPVINLSLSGDANKLVSLALRRVTADRTVLVAAVGNGGPDTSPAYPASEPSVIGVTALDSRLQPYAAASRGEDVDFSAPGVRIWTPGSDAAGTYNSGTSFAAPYVTATVAAQIANGAVADPDRIAATLAATVIDLGVPGKDTVFGWGLIRSQHPCAAPTQSSTVGRTVEKSSASVE